MSIFLSGKSVQLRALVPEDSVAVADFVNDQDLTRNMKMGTFPASAHDCMEELGSGLSKLPGVLQSPHVPTDILFMVHRRFQGTPTLSNAQQIEGIRIGIVGLFGIDWVNRMGELRAITRAAKCGSHMCGYEACLLTLSYAFGKLNLNKVCGGYLEGHATSAALLKKLGFVKEGKHRAEVLRSGVYYDTVIASVLQDEFYERFSGERSRFEITWRPNELGRDTKEG